MSTLYLHRQGSVLRSVNGSFMVVYRDETVATHPADLISEVLVLGGVSVTTPALRDLMERGGTLHVLTLGGRHVGFAGSGARGHARLLRAQVHATGDPDRQRHLARNLLRGKLRNARAALQRYRRVQDTGAHTHALAVHEQLLLELPGLPDHAALLGAEGHAASTYFAALRATLGSPWQVHFTGRNRRPPPDPVNALLSFGYALLLGHLLTDLHRVGLHPAMGVLHVEHGARPALALDLMEEHRPALVDRLVVTALHRRLFTPEMFSPVLDGRGVHLNTEGRRVFLALFAERIGTPVVGHVSRAAPSYRDLLTRQVRAFAHAVQTGDDYQPAFMK